MTTKQSHTPEPWPEINQAGDLVEIEQADYDRARVCVNALAGIRNPAAVRGLIEAARNLQVDERFVDAQEFTDALAALDQEPKP